MIYDYYSENSLISLKKINKKYMALCIAFFVIFISVLTLFLIFVNDTNIVLFKIVLSIISSLCLCFIFYAVIEIFVKNNSYKKHINSIVKNENTQQIVGEIINIENGITSERNIFCKEITLKRDNKKYVYFLNENCENNITVGSTYLLFIRDRYIVGDTKNE